MPTIEQNLDYWRSYEWPQGGDEWSGAWGDSANLWAATLLPRLSGFLPARHVLEIAPGYGRVTQYLVRYADRLTAVDLVPKCVRACKRRFRSRRGIFGGTFRAYVNDGRSLAMVPDGSVDLVVSWDSLVHAEADVLREYLRQLAAKLRPGGAGLLHHSNIGAFEKPGGSGLSVENPHWRAATMSAAKFRAYCAEFGLLCLNQELIPWGGDVLNDCLSFFARPGRVAQESPARETRIVENRDFWNEAWRMKDLRTIYSVPGE